MLVQVKLLKEGARFPEYKKDLDVGADVCMPDRFILMPGVMNKVPLGIATFIPQGFKGNIIPRSGTLLRGIMVHNPAIDPGYTGEVHAMVTILGNDPIVIAEGERICSFELTPTVRCQFVEAIASDRGDAGFNSTGK